MLKTVLKQLKSHAPFTFAGAVFGVSLALIFRGISHETSYNLFYIFHPLHVVLSALVTASMYKLHNKKPWKGWKGLTVLLVIGYVGSVGIATLSDSVVPYIGETLLKMPDRGIHLGFIEKWWLINPLAILGVLWAYFKPTTKFPHGGHVLLSTWASLFHVLMAKAGVLSFTAAFVIIPFLFIAVWLPCCVSDIVFPLLFVREEKIH
ncbi:MAG: hypothetical protein DRI44_01385 [Chlamydiae bacterium]|nr:MAG: hypothetical protein DRI44_01385 [Chlamydiota bacterium]